MTTSRLWVLALLIAASGAGCNCGHAVVTRETDGGELADAGTADAGDSGTVTPDGGDAGPGVDGGQDAGPDAGPVDTDAGVLVSPGGPGSLCLAPGASCSTTSGGVCCSGVCSGGTCATASFCGGGGSACVHSTDCCTNHCVGGTCSIQQCLDVGGVCAGPSDCCSNTCDGTGHCAAVPGSTNACAIIGQACGSNCCSTNCQGGVCVRAFSCQAYNDVCQTGADCCSGECTIQSGAIAGLCAITTGGGSGGCSQSGIPCTDGTGCCSRECIDQGSGVKVCQPVGGCRVTGDFCSTDSACCGSNTGNNVTCDPSADRCSQGQACNANGVICGKPVQILADGGVDWVRTGTGSQFTVNFNSNCCDSIPVTGPGSAGKDFSCRLDQGGVPRCFGGSGLDAGTCPHGYTGDPGCCIDTGNACQFRDQCCNGELCLPGADGGVQCLAAASCSPVGTQCDPAASSCCAGTTCTVQELGAVCLSDSSLDAGTRCVANAGNCSAGSECCSGICTSGMCVAPAQCQSQGALCSASGDCCSGLTCVFGSGTANGTCEVSSGCSNIGQSCTSSTTCCSGLVCLDNNTGANCNGTAACSCSVLIQ